MQFLVNIVLSAYQKQARQIEIAKTVVCEHIKAARPLTCISICHKTAYPACVGYWASVQLYSNIHRCENMNCCLNSPPQSSNRVRG